MFGLFKKGPEAKDDGLDYDSVTVHYEGEVMSPDYIADTLSNPESDEQGYPYHMLVPHGLGKLTTNYMMTFLNNMKEILRSGSIREKEL